MHPLQADEFRADLFLVQEVIRSSVTAKRVDAQDKHWERWDEFCHKEGIDPFMRNIADPVPYLQVFGQCYRDDRIAPSGKSVRSQTVEDALRAVGQKFSSLGTLDIQKDLSGRTDHRIRRQLRC